MKRFIAFIALAIYSFTITAKDFLPNSKNYFLTYSGKTKNIAFSLQNALVGCELANIPNLPVIYVQDIMEEDFFKGIGLGEESIKKILGPEIPSFITSGPGSQFSKDKKLFKKFKNEYNISDIEFPTELREADYYAYIFREIIGNYVETFSEIEESNPQGLKFKGKQVQAYGWTKNQKNKSGRSTIQILSHDYAQAKQAPSYNNQRNAKFAIRLLLDAPYKDVELIIVKGHNEQFHLNFDNMIKQVNKWRHSPLEASPNAAKNRRKYVVRSFQMPVISFENDFEKNSIIGIDSKLSIKGKVSWNLDHEGIRMRNVIYATITKCSMGGPVATHLDLEVNEGFTVLIYNKNESLPSDGLIINEIKEALNNIES